MIQCFPDWPRRVLFRSGDGMKLGIDVVNMAARGLAGICDRSSVLTGRLLQHSFRGKSRIVEHLRGRALPAEMLVERRGVQYRLLMSDRLQRGIYFNVFDSAGRTLPCGTSHREVCAWMSAPTSGSLP